MAKYTVVLRCRNSLFRIPQERGIQIAPMRTEYGDYELVLQQRSEQLPNIKLPIPREPWIEVTGPAPSLEAAVSVAVASASDYARQIAFGANAWQGLVDVHLAYESTDGLTERQFFQNWIVDERGLPRVAREIDPDLLYRLLVAIARLSATDRARLIRAVVQYTDALQHWKPGSELYALAHLYMGVEAITPLILQREIGKRGLKDRKQLEMILDGPPADSWRLRLATKLYRWTGGYIPSRLEPWARRELIFRGDKETYRAAQQASNQLEHGLKDHADIHALAVRALGKTGAYLREAMLGLLPLDDADREQLTVGTFAAPLPAGGSERQLLGTLKSEEGPIAASDQLHPYVRWEFNLLDYFRNDAGAPEMRVAQTIKPFLGPKTALKVERIAFAGPTASSATNVEFDIRKGDAPKEEIRTAAGAQLEIDPPAVADWAALVGKFLLNANSLPHLARFWLARLDPSLDDAVHALGLQECIDRILAIVESDPRLVAHRVEAEELWREAIGGEEIRLRVALARIGQNGLILPVMPADGRASEVTDPQALRELIDGMVQLAKRLATLLDELLASRT